MQPNEIKTLIEQGLTDAQAEVYGNDGHFEAIVVYPGFAGQNTVKQHQTIYALLNEQIKSNAIHALSLKTYTPEAWEQAKKLKVSGA